MKKTTIFLASLLLGTQAFVPVISLADSVDSTPEVEQRDSETVTTAEESTASTIDLDNDTQTTTASSSDELMVPEESYTNATQATITTFNEPVSTREDSSIDSWMPDKNLQAIIADQLANDNFTQEDMQYLYNLNIDSQSISDLKGLAYATNLTDLTITNTDLSNTANLAEIGTLANLEYLTATDDQLSDLSFAKNGNLVAIKQINLTNNDIQNLNYLAGESFPSLEYIDLSHNQINDISIIKGINAPNLAKMLAAYNQISDIAPIAESTLTNLAFLDVGNNLITNIDDFANSSFTKLVTLLVNDNQISDISVMKNLNDRYPDLHIFNVDNNYINSIEFMEGYDLNSYTSAKNQVYEETVTKIKPVGEAAQPAEIAVPITSLNYEYDSSIGYYTGTPDPTAETLSLMEIMGASSLKLTDGSIQEVADENNRVQSFLVTPTQTRALQQVSFTWRGAQGQYTGTGLININWVDAQAPTIEANDQTLSVGDTFDPLASVTASDQQLDGSEPTDLTDKIEIVSNTVDPNKAGTYTIEYTVTNAYGLTTTKKVTVTVAETENKQMITGEDFTMYIGDQQTPTAADFKASATDKDGNDSAITVDLSQADLTKVGDYPVILTSADGQTKQVTLHILAKNASTATDNKNTPTTTAHATNLAVGTGKTLPKTNEQQNSLTTLGGLFLLVMGAIVLFWKERQRVAKK